LMVNENRTYDGQTPQAVRYQNQLDEKGIPNWTPPEF
jgi:hypothetical protein